MALTFNSATVSVGDTTKKKQYTRLMDNTVIAVPGDSGMPSKIFHSSATFLSTFAATTIISRTSTSGIALGVGEIGQSATASVATMKYKIIDIGPWNMDTTGLIKKETYIHWNKWREVQVLIYPDAGYDYDIMDFEVAIQAKGGPWVHNQTGFWENSSAEADTEIGLARIASGFYRPNAYFTSTSANRGKITIRYEE